MILIRPGSTRQKKKTVLTSGIKLKMSSIQTKLIPPIRMLLQKIELEVESDIVDR